MFVGKKAARKSGNVIDKLALNINEIAQSKIDRTTDRIDSELNSCGRELTSAGTTLNQIKPLIDRLVQQVGQNAPDHVNVLVGSIATEIMGKVNGSIDNIKEVQKNIKDVDELTDMIDKYTDEIGSLVDQIDAATDAWQD